MEHKNGDIIKLEDGTRWMFINGAYFIYEDPEKIPELIKEGLKDGKMIIDMLKLLNQCIESKEKS